MTPEEHKQAMKEAQIKTAEKLYGKIDPKMVNLYQNVFLRNQEGQIVLRDMLSQTGVFAHNITEQDLALRNFGNKLIHILAGVHVDPTKLESLYGIFINSLIEYERDTTPTG